MYADTVHFLSFIIAMIAYISIVGWGLKKVSGLLQCGSMLIEVEDYEAENNSSAAPKKSFSRAVGTIGALGLAAVVVALGFWIIYSLFYDGDLSRMEDLSTYFLSGSALFAPYAFNKISSVFK
ncbi:hypothetical protein [Pleionea sp. CnH1-48]|uniref:hypothetical protein n=1 Tax=Pleionea sp. CnH1-48 TaxID=2954494 RepID=UPI00209813C6|nr:hypothetical protein [Pleionea sp. CnH1-48]MCO7224388.1 hypothetical protein [Pleionea sp. CnH1-48]